MEFVESGNVENVEKVEKVEKDISLGNVILEENIKLEKEEIQEKINVQIFKIDDLKKCIEYIKEVCILPIMKKADFDTIDKIMIAYRTINASFETLRIGQEIISKL